MSSSGIDIYNPQIPTSSYKENGDNYETLIVRNETPILVDEVVLGTKYYIGYAKIGSSLAGAVWKIKKAELIGSVWIFKYADGNLEYDNIWNDRAILTYV